MAVYKCKMCGGSLEITDDSVIAVCDYCGTKQTVPSADDDKKIALYSRANKLRYSCEFDKAATMYENIIAEFPYEAEAFWGLILCKYGIEYVDDPATAKKIPTCHRSSFNSVLEDSDFEKVMEYADQPAISIYRDEAKEIERLRKEILEVSSKEEPYDIFICYKETDGIGYRTIDSVIAQDLYKSLIDEGYRVFFSRISLEDKLGTAYESYIFAALNSAKVMLVVGTSYENFNAVWVKNEWSRYLHLIAKGEKKTLIPCYKDIDAYDIPKEFKHLQAQDMGKVGATQDLLRGISKLLPKGPNNQNEGSISQQKNQNNAKPLLERAYLFLEEHNWETANEYFEKVLDIEPKNSNAYLGKFLSSMQIASIEDFSLKYKSGEELSDDRNLQLARRFADNEINLMLSELDRERKKAIEQKQQEKEKLKKKIKEVWKNLYPITKMISCCGDTSACVTTGGTILTHGGRYIGNAQMWKNNIAVSVGASHILGLKNNNTTFADGSNISGCCIVAEWTDIKSIAAGRYHSVGLRTDGTVVAVGDNRKGSCDVSKWKSISDVAAGHYHTVGLCSDGKVVAVGNNDYGQCNVADWSEIIGITAGAFHTVGLKNDGTVIATGANTYKQCDVNNWNDIVSVVAGANHTVGVKIDGTVISAGNNVYGQLNTSEWYDIVAVAAGDYHTIGVKKDGTVVAVGANGKGQCDLQGWKLFDDYLEIERELIEKEEESKQRFEQNIKVELEKKINEYEKSKATMEKELSELKGLFTTKKREDLQFRIEFVKKKLKELRNQLQSGG